MQKVRSGRAAKETMNKDAADAAADTLRQRLTIQTWLAWNSHKSTVCLQGGGIKGMCHYTGSIFNFFSYFVRITQSSILVSFFLQFSFPNERKTFIQHTSKVYAEGNILLQAPVECTIGELNKDKKVLEQTANNQYGETLRCELQTKWHKELNN